MYHDQLGLIQIVHHIFWPRANLPRKPSVFGWFSLVLLVGSMPASELYIAGLQAFDIGVSRLPLG